MRALLLIAIKPDFPHYISYKHKLCLTPMRVATIENPENISVSKEVEKLESLCTVRGSVKWYSCYKKQYGGSSKHLT